MRTGCSQQAIVKTFHILPYIVKQQATGSGLHYTENSTPAHSFWKYTIKAALVLLCRFYEFTYLYTWARIKIFVWTIILSIIKPNVFYDILAFPT